MKKCLFYLTLLCIIGPVIHPADAQQKIEPTDVKKIILNGSDGGATGSRGFELEVLNEHGKWNCYQTEDNEVEQNIPDLNRHVVEQILIGRLPARQIDNFFKSIAVIKPQFDAKALNITAPILIDEIKNKAKDTAGNTIHLNHYITEAAVQHATTICMVDGSVDTYSDFRIAVVKSNNDTLKIKTHNVYATMLPWTINKMNTYDMGINDFVIAAMCGREYINKAMLSLHYLKEKIYQFIDAGYPSRPISTYRWKYCYNDNLKLLRANFKPDFAVGKEPGFDNEYDLKLKTDMMPANMYLNTSINPEERPAILALIHYSKFINKYLKRGNFIFKYYQDRPQYSTSFSYYYKSSANLNIVAAKKHIPLLKNIDVNKTLPFEVYMPGKFFSGDWFLLLPDNRFVMAHRYVNKPGTAITPVFPADDPNANGLNSTLVYTLFNADGTVVK